MYEIFIDDIKKIIEPGNILFANLVLSGEDNSLYYFDKKEVLVTRIRMEKCSKSINENSNQWC